MRSGNVRRLISAQPKRQLLLFLVQSSLSESRNIFVGNGFVLFFFFEGSTEGERIPHLIFSFSFIGGPEMA